MRILMVGDVVGRTGRRMFAKTVPLLRKDEHIDHVVVNGENATHGKGLQPQHFNLLLESGADTVTLGNHAFAKKEVLGIIDDERLLRPANFPPKTPGHGTRRVEICGQDCAVMSLHGAGFMPVSGVQEPLWFLRRYVDEALGARRDTRVVIVDFHAESTAEKKALAFYMDGRVSAILGTHTHVQTADEQVLRNGTAFITDVGMCGAYESVIGWRGDLSGQRYLSPASPPIQPAFGRGMFNAVIVDIDDASGRSTAIRRVSVVEERWKEQLEGDIRD